MAGGHRNEGEIKRCSSCGGMAWSFWSRVPIETLPQLVPILDDLDAWRLRDAVVAEVDCLNCFEPAYAFRARSPSELSA